MAQAPIIERLISLEGASNFRDLGGYETVDGATVQWGRVYRADALHDLTESDVDRLLGFGLSEVYDLRTSRELEAFGTNPLVDYGVTYHHVSLVAEVGGGANEAAVPVDGSRTVAAYDPTDHEGFAARYLEMLEAGKASVARVMAGIAAAEGDPVVFHCTGGRDRTGLIAALLLSLAGVPDETIAADYHLTERHLRIRPERVERMRVLYGATVVTTGPIPTPAEVMLHTLRGLADRYGSPAAYLDDAGVTADVREALTLVLTSPSALDLPGR